ncbi:hypothetical protein KAU55_01165 [Candidatus Bathyarchaeota archaeon]|nr:hypothetical protein [Candidatus Bathyarchaeota archaeon]
MPRARLTPKRVVIGIALIIIGVVILDRTLFYRGLQTSFEDKPLFLLAAFMSSVTIAFGGCVIGGMQTKRFLKVVLMTGLWIFSVVLPVWLLPLPEEISVLAFSFSLLLPVLLYGCYEKWKTKGRKGAENEGK